MNGVGDELAAIIKWGRLSPPTDCNACDQLRKQMNGWGPDGCRERADEIIMRLRVSANEHRKPFWAPGARLLLNVAISRAIRNARRK